MSLDVTKMIDDNRDPEEFHPVLNQGEKERLQQFFQILRIQQAQEQEAVLERGKVLTAGKAKRKAK